MHNQEDILHKAVGGRVSKGLTKSGMKSYRISELLRDMYPWTYKPGDVSNYYYQHQDGTPLFQVETNVAGQKDDCRVIFKNELRRKDWNEIEKPTKFSGTVWPPKYVSDLLGCSTSGEICVECAVSEPQQAPGFEYMDWSKRMHEFWLDNIRLCRIPKVNYGLRARKHILARTCIGEYTGELTPHDETLSNERTQYHFEVDIGKICQEGGVQTVCWLDATRKGSIFRFANHSCDPNAQIDVGRCGIHNRILYVYTLKDIAIDEQITISYGDDWFSQQNEPCRCGSNKCKNPPKKRTEEKTPDGDNKLSRKDENKNTKLPRNSTARNEEKRASKLTKAAAPRVQQTKESSPGPRRSARLASGSPTEPTSSKSITPGPAIKKRRLRRKKPQVVMNVSDDEDVAPPKKEHSPPKKARRAATCPGTDHETGTHQYVYICNKEEECSLSCIEEIRFIMRSKICCEEMLTPATSSMTTPLRVGRRSCSQLGCAGRLHGSVHNCVSASASYHKVSRWTETLRLTYTKASVDDCDWCMQKQG
jgi:hypothetical protein